MAAGKVKAYYFEDKRTGKKRNTPVFATSAAAAKKKLKRPSAANARVYATRTPKIGETKGGKWSRIRANGKGPKGSVKNRGYGPPLKK